MAEKLEDARPSNFDWNKAEPYLKRYEEVQAQIDEIMNEAKVKCEPLREDQKVIKKEAEEDGFRKKPFNAVISERKHIRKANAIRENLDEDQKDDYDKIKHALGMMADLPLGEAALKK